MAEQRVLKLGTSADSDSFEPCFLQPLARLSAQLVKVAAGDAFEILSEFGVRLGSILELVDPEGVTEELKQFSNHRIRGKLGVVCERALRELIAVAEELQ